MENYFNMNLEKQDIDAISNLGLAHMGDCVFEILCRGYLCAKGGKNVGNLHRDTINMVKASSQAKFADRLLPLLTDRELAALSAYARSRSRSLETLRAERDALLTLLEGEREQTHGELLHKGQVYRSVGYLGGVAALLLVL